MPPRRPALSKAEWTLMNICWRFGKSTARQIHEQSIKAKKREYRTVKTLLDRIAAKGYLEVEKLGPLCLFTPAVSRSRALGTAIDDFVGTVLDDALSPLFLHLANEKEMSPEEVASLRELLEKSEGRAKAPRKTKGKKGKKT